MGVGGKKSTASAARNRNDGRGTHALIFHVPERRIAHEAEALVSLTAPPSQPKFAIPVACCWGAIWSPLISHRSIFTSRAGTAMVVIERWLAV
jgi:hypothetical protein